MDYEKSIYSSWFCHFIVSQSKNVNDFISRADKLGYEFVDMKDYIVASRLDNGYWHRRNRQKLAELIQQYANFEKIPHYDLVFDSIELYRIESDRIEKYAL